MKSNRVFVATAVSVVALSSAAFANEEKVLNIYNWSDYIAEDTIQKFEEKTGIKVNYDVYDSNEVLEAKLLAGRTGYDIAVPTGSFLERQIKAGIYAELPKDKLPNLANMDPVLMKQAAKHDADNAHSVIYMWGTNGFGYNPAKVTEAAGPDAPVDSWDLVFNPVWAEKVSKCGLYMFDSPSEVFPSLLAYLGLDPNTTNPDDYAKVEEAMMKVRPFVTKFHSSEYINALANGDICVALGYSGDMSIAAARAEEAANGVEITYTIPKEGAEMWFDFLTILKDAPHPENAAKFINFVMDPQITADITNYVWYANANVPSLELVDEEVRTNPGVFPSDEVKEKLFVKVTPPTNIERLRTRIWNKIKTGQ